MSNYNISINEELAAIVEKEMKRQKYANRSEFFRDLIRRHYLEEYTIEELSPDDPDYKLIAKRKKNAHLVPLESLIR